MKDKALPVKKHNLLEAFLLIFKGILVGFGAIMPGISGGTLCVVFGMYRPIIETLSNPLKGIKKYWLKLISFIIGGAIGFVGLSGLADKLMAANSTAVICAFMGFVIGTLPELWRDAGKEGRKKSSYVSVLVGFVVMLAILITLRTLDAIQIKADIIGFIFCGLMWGLSFVIPGLSSSTLLIFFGLYQPMLNGISHFSFKTLIPLAIGFAACMLLLPRFVNKLFEKKFSIASHTVFGIVIATTIMIFPDFKAFSNGLFLNIACIIGGALLSYLLGYICSLLPVDENNK